MAKTINWDSRIGRRVRLQDLHVLFAVAQCGSMAKAATQLGVSQSAVSQMISNLEHALGVPLLDRSSRGVQATVYGKSLLKRGRAAFDELRQAVQEIEFLSDPAVGEVRIASNEPIFAGLLPTIIKRFFDQYPGVNLDVDSLTVSSSVSKLRDRSLDLYLTRGAMTPTDISKEQDLTVTHLFNDTVTIVAGIKSPWCRRRKMDIAELAQARWLLSPSGLPTEIITEAFRLRGLAMPKIRLKSFSIHIRTHLMTSGPFVSTLPRSVLDLWGSSLPLKVLPIDLPVRPWPVSLITLKNRTLSPATARFIEVTRQVCNEVAMRLQTGKSK